MNAYNYEQEYKDALINELQELLNKYNQRIIDNNNTTDKHHLEKKDAIKIIEAGASVGGMVGTAIPIPGAGNVIGAAAGAALAAGIAGIIEVLHRRHNKKIDNADRVRSYLDHNTLEQTATQVIAERANMINNLPHPDRDKKRIVQYLAANITAAIKHNPNVADNNKVQAAVDGLAETRSKKVHDYAHIGLKRIARG